MDRILHLSDNINVVSMVQTVSRTFNIENHSSYGTVEKTQSSIGSVEEILCLPNDSNSGENSSKSIKRKNRFSLSDIVWVSSQLLSSLRDKIIYKGGGLAKLSGIALNFTDILISVSGPGITHAHATVDQTRDIPMETINRRIFNIYHDRDLVPWTDKQEGLIQIVTCPKEFKRIQCHYVTPLFCHVVRICGNPRGFKVNPNICIP